MLVRSKEVVVTMVRAITFCRHSRGAIAAALFVASLVGGSLGILDLAFLLHVNYTSETRIENAGFARAPTPPPESISVNQLISIQPVWVSTALEELRVCTDWVIPPLSASERPGFYPFIEEPPRPHV